MRVLMLELGAARLRRNPWITALSCAPWVWAAVLLTSQGAGDRAMAPVMAVVGAILFGLAWVTRPFARRKEVRVALTDSELRIGDEVVPRARVTAAEVWPDRPEPRVRVRTRWRMARDLYVQDVRAAQRLLAALGFAPSQTTAAYRLQSLAVVRHRRAPFLLLPLGFVLFLLGGALRAAWLPALTPLLFAALVSFYLIPAKIVVGVDGLLLRWLWVRELIGTKGITRVGRFEIGTGRNRISGVEIALRGAPAVKLPIRSTWGGDDPAAALLQRIGDVVALANASARAADEARVLDRGALPVRDWIGRLRALGSGAAGSLRTAAVMPEQLWRVAQDPEQPAVLRAAAAVALGPTLDPSGRAQLEAIARTTVTPRLRVAIERATEDASDEELEEALSALADG